LTLLDNCRFDEDKPQIRSIPLLTELEALSGAPSRRPLHGHIPFFRLFYLGLASFRITDAHTANFDRSEGFTIDEGALRFLENPGLVVHRFAPFFHAG
jgi:hypothetical protein